MDRFDTMRVYTRIVERRSFTRAAEDLNLPRATVTDAIKALEERVGVRLLLRTTRQVTPTLEGEAFYARCLSLIADLEDAEGAFRSSPQGPLRIDVHGTMARRLLFPRLPEFLARYPGVALDVSEGDRYVDLVREGVDCAIRAGELRDSDLMARRLTLLDEATVASPDYCARHGDPRSVDTLAHDGHVMVGFHSTASAAVLPLEFLVDGQRRELQLPYRVRVRGAESYLGAALAGCGLIQAPRYRLARHLAVGNLVAVLPHCPPSPTPVNIVYARTRLPSPRLRVFIDWACEAFPATTY
ncbi:LysR family transcriptional regulator [Xanthomonas maliensis]|uniref:LysR family transcriptional regulator n=1 Tax=Xanthomonas maliensis TaxID=1321368 RepID=UPI00039E5967|nr:LysR family transcriptional regulator [Xanthomonas maliensis]KAB7767058.1 LysR family transcriptional regulator [Xanthomonas maliensis]